MKKALVCCGGGGRGILDAALLALVGKDVFDQFDFYAGTSIGSINLLSMLTFGDPEKLYNFFVKHISKVFKKGVRTRIPLFSYKYNDKVLNELLKEHIPGKFGEIKKPFLAVSHDITKGCRKLWMSDDPKDADIPAWEVARASSAAHTYFPPWQAVDGHWHADGGVFANDPSVPLVAHLYDKYKIDPNGFKLFVMGTGYANSPQHVRRQGPPKWVGDWVGVLKEDAITNVVDSREDALAITDDDKYYLADFDIGEKEIKLDDVEACLELPQKCLTQIHRHATAMEAFVK